MGGNGNDQRTIRIMERRMKSLPQLADYPIPDTNLLELRLLSSMICDPTIINDVVRSIKVDMFSCLENKRIWQVINDMHINREKIDLSSVMTRVDRNYYINHILSTPPEAGVMGLQGLINSFTDTYIKRMAYLTSVDTLYKINNGDNCLTITDNLDGFKARVMDGFKDECVKTTSEIANDLAEEITKGDIMRIPSSFRSVDFNTYGGFASGNLVILAARPSVGKTTIGLQMALNASRNGYRTMVFSLEMSREELVQRLILSTGHITPYEYFTKQFDWGQYDLAVKEVTNDNLLINDKSYNIDEICQKIKVDCQTNDLKFVMIDYLGLIPPNSNTNLSAAIGELTRKLKLTAKACRIPILLLSQLSRDNEKQDRSPELKDLRNSGDIEQDADIVIMLEHSKDSEKRIIENSIDLWIRKNRNGRCNFDNPIVLRGNETYSNFKEENF